MTSSAASNRPRRPKSLPSLSKSTGTLPNFRNCFTPNRRDSSDLRIHPSKYARPSSSFSTFNPPPCRFSYTGFDRMNSSLNRSAPQFSLFERRPYLKKNTVVPGPKYNVCGEAETKTGREYVHGPRYFPDFASFRSDPHYKSRTSIFAECGNTDKKRVLGPGRYRDQEAFRKSTKRIQEPQYSWSSKSCIKVVSPKKGSWSKPGRKILVEWAKTPFVKKVKVTLWRAKTVVQVFERSTNKSSSEKRLKSSLVPGMYRFRVEEVGHADKYAWSALFEIEKLGEGPKTSSTLPVFSTFGKETVAFDSNKRTQPGTSWGWRNKV
mmetsp:Transcript_39280/g.62920  ORF Transcript_39280/g.62920 Transcript_39280/m.62920 type:complete len:321 (-) Transcript_39280:203-1165(-)